MSAIDIGKAAELLLENFYTVGVVFNWDTASVQKKYTYKVHKSLKVEVEDLLLARANGEVKMVKVVEVHDENEIDYGANFKYKWAFAKVDIEQLEKLEELDRRVIKSVEVVERRRKKRELLDELKSDMNEDDLKFLTDGLDIELLESKDSA